MNAKTHAAAQVVIAKDGPYLVSGAVALTKQTIGANEAGESVKWIAGEAFATQSQYALCRCGRSAHKPFCDGSHTRAKFDGTETASREPYRRQATMQQGPAMSLSDAEPLCAFARFCDAHGKIWNLVQRTDDAAARRHFVQEAGDCPSGRLVAWDNATGEPVEPTYSASIGVVEDPAQSCSGPLALRGGIAVVGADGFKYEVRNRVTLCRCGASKNKPFCDGSHAAIKFQDNL